MFSYCPNCQSKLTDQDTEHYLECSNCNFTYYFNPAPAVAGIIICKGQVLFNVRAQEPSKGMLDLPGGFVDKDERLEDALQREVKEELGINIDNWQYLTSQTNRYVYKGITYPTCDAIFVSYLDEMPHIVKQETEVAATVWLTPDHDLLKHIGFESLREGLSFFIKNKGKLSS